LKEKELHNCKTISTFLEIVVEPIYQNKNCGLSSKESNISALLKAGHCGEEINQNLTSLEKTRSRLGV
jgi:hypothetical protein